MSHLNDPLETQRRSANKGSIDMNKGGFWDKLKQGVAKSELIEKESKEKATKISRKIGFVLIAITVLLWIFGDFVFEYFEIPFSVETVSFAPFWIAILLFSRSAKKKKFSKFKNLPAGHPMQKVNKIITVISIVSLIVGAIVFFLIATQFID
jgi:hypothetical protein